MKGIKIISVERNPVVRGVINVQYVMGGLHFDAALDFPRRMHHYSGRERNYFPIELYCFDDEDADIRMVFKKWDGMDAAAQIDTESNFVSEKLQSVLRAETKAWFGNSIDIDLKND